MFNRKQKSSRLEERKNVDIATLLGFDLNQEDVADLEIKGLGSDGIGDDDADADADDESLETELAALCSESSSEAQEDQAVETKLPIVERTKALELSMTRRDQYRMAALSCKRAGDVPQAKQFLTVSKQINSFIEQLEQHKDVDISQLPPAPCIVPSSDETLSNPQEAVLQESPVLQPSLLPPLQPKEPSNDEEIMEPNLLSKDVAVALQRRMEKYKQAVEQAKKESNSSKTRRMGRIVQQYEDAIKCHKAGKPVLYDELPTPPGFPPIPGVKIPDDTLSSEESASEPVPSPAPQISVLLSPYGSKDTLPSGQGSPHSPKSVKTLPSQNEQQVRYLLERQKEFKMAALQSKRQGDLESAKNSLRISKGIENMILSAQSGLRIDVSSVPPSPFVAANPAPVGERTLEMVESQDITTVPNAPQQVQELFSRLEDALIQQIEMCRRNAHHYKTLGDISNTKSFEKMAKNLRHDLDAVQNARKLQDPPPRFHYEDRSFTIIKSFPELSDSEVEITVVRALNINLPSGYQPKDMYTYVTYEFPFPSGDNPQTGRTQTVKQSINPGYNEVFKVNIDRKGRSLARIFKRQTVKFDVKYERGFLKGDRPLGQVQVKLAEFHNKCEIHECLDLMDTERGRKAVGGKLELHLRIREPLAQKDVKIEKWKWLVIDMHLTSREVADRTVNVQQ